MDNAEITMMYRFTITKTRAEPALLQALVTMAVRQTDFVFGPACRKLETDIRLSAQKPICEINGGRASGQRLARVLAAFLIKQGGEDGFGISVFTE